VSIAVASFLLLVAFLRFFFFRDEPLSFPSSGRDSGESLLSSTLLPARAKIASQASSDDAIGPAAAGLLGPSVMVDRTFFHSTTIVGVTPGETPYRPTLPLF
jgi:hypothetical protein